MTTLPGVAELGRTYNAILGGWADLKSCGPQLFDFSRVPKKTVQIGSQSYSIPNIVQVEVNNNVSQIFTYGRNIDASLGDLCNKTILVGGLTPGFVGSVAEDYGVQEISNEKYAFGRYQVTYEKYDLELPSYDNYKAYTKPHVVKLAGSASTTQVYDQIGTHILRAFTVGARAVLSVVADASVYDTRAKLEAALRAAYDEIASVSSANTTQYGPVFSTLASHASIKLTLTNGSNILALSDPSNFGFELSKWKQEVEGETQNLGLVNLRRDTFLHIQMLAPPSIRGRFDALKYDYDAYYLEKYKSFNVTSGPLLLYKWVPSNQKLFHTDGLGENNSDIGTADIAICRPQLEPGWHYLGQQAIIGTEYDGSSKSLAVKEIVPGTALSTSINWETTWEASRANLPYFSGHRGVASNPNFKVLGYLLKKTNKSG
eukprot:Phypoly_transcript_05728.p1 GENE.Phypoly_transcript_05728~~Phypoly_transcript_05728.p1  ORF type:complete len:457 (+),score=52.21 Phypoly_transcript_05728:82-1371(+)